MESLCVKCMLILIKKSKVIIWAILRDVSMSDDKILMCNAEQGWGMGISYRGHSTMLSTWYNYIALRLLGERAEGSDQGALGKSRRWILDHGSLTIIPSWGKIVLLVN